MASSTSVKSKGKKIVFSNKAGKSVNVDWLQADPKLMQELVAVCNDAGCAPSFAVTSDGGAWRIYFLHQDIEPDDRNQYCPGTENIDGWLHEYIEFWRGVQDDRKRR